MLATPYREPLEGVADEHTVKSTHPLLTTWINGLAHQMPIFPRISGLDVDLFQSVDLSGTRQAHDQRLAYFATEQLLREVAPVVVEEIELYNYAKRMRSLSPLTSATAAQKALDVCFAVPQSTSIHPIDRRTLIMSTLICAVSALPTSNWFYAMTNTGTTASIYIKTARNHAQALTQIYELFADLVAFARTPEAQQRFD